MHELNTQDKEVITADGCDFQWHNIKSAVNLTILVKVHCYL